MFDIGLPEFAVLAITALFIFGPERLPQVARKAAQGLRQVRTMATTARRDLADELGPEFDNFDFRDLNPRNAVRKYVMEGIDEDDLRIDRDVDRIRDDLDDDDDDRPRRRERDEPEPDDEVAEVAEVGVTPRDTASESGLVEAVDGDAQQTKVATKARDLPPYDPDAT